MKKIFQIIVTYIQKTNDHFRIDKRTRDYIKTGLKVRCNHFYVKVKTLYNRDY